VSSDAVPYRNKGLEESLLSYRNTGLFCELSLSLFEFKLRRSKFGREPMDGFEPIDGFEEIELGALKDGL